jgi:hypothetical protein
VQELIRVAELRGEVSNLAIVVRRQPAGFDDRDLAALRLDDQRRREQVDVQVAVEEVPLAGPDLLRAPPAGADAAVDDPGSAALPFEAAGR